MGKDVFKMKMEKNRFFFSRIFHSFVVNKMTSALFGTIRINKFSFEKGLINFWKNINIHFNLFFGLNLF
jgi:hypothetical protein